MGEALSSKQSLLLAAGAYVLLRVLVLHTAFDEVGLWMYELFPMGTMAEILLRRIDLPTHYFYDNAAGQVLCAYLTVPAFAVLGSSYLALKTVPFLMGVGTLFLVHSLLRRAFGALAAALGACLLVLPPTTFFKYSLVCSGNHFENVFFTALLLWCFYRVHSGEPSRWGLCALGAAAGAALFVFLGAFIPIGILVLVHLGLRGGRATLRDCAAVLPGFLLAVSPLVVLNIRTGGRGLGFLSAKFEAAGTGKSEGLKTAIERSAEYVGTHLPRAATYPDFAGISGSILDWVFFAAMALATLACIPLALRGASRLERASLLPMVLYAPLAALAFGLSNLVFALQMGRFEFAAYRYMLPTFFFGMLAIAVVCARAWERGVGRGGAARAGAVLLFGAAILPGLSNLNLVDWTFSRTGLGARYDGYDLSKIARVLLGARNRLSPAEIEAHLEDFPPLVRARVTRAIGFNLSVLAIEKQERGASWVDLESVLAEYPPDRHADLAHGAGIGARFMQARSPGGTIALPAVLSRTAERLSPRVQGLLPDVLDGAAAPNPNLPPAEDVPMILADNGTLIARCVELDLPPEITAGLARGHGHLCGRLLRRGIAGDVARVDSAASAVQADLRPAFQDGLRAGFREPGEPSAAERAILERTLSLH